MRLVQLMAAEGGPADEPAMRYADMASASGLAEVAAYADAIGVDLRMILGADGQATPLVADAHGAGLEVHGWTLRKENVFLPASFKSGGGESAVGNFAGFYGALAATGLDGIFTDDPALAARQ